MCIRDRLQMMQEELSESDSNREAQLLYGNTDKYGIYQLKDDPELDKCHIYRYFHTKAVLPCWNHSLKEMCIRDRISSPTSPGTIRKYSSVLCT